MLNSSQPWKSLRVAFIPLLPGAPPNVQVALQTPSKKEIVAHRSIKRRGILVYHNLEEQSRWGVYPPGVTLILTVPELTLFE
jgi:hypothetical protein